MSSYRLVRVLASKCEKISEKGVHPFVPMKPNYRHMALGVFLVYLLSVALLALINGTVGAEWVIPALILAVFAQIIPLIYYRSGYGWFHPLIFGALYSFYELLRKFSMFAWGLEYNDGLPTYSLEELAKLVAYGLLLSALGQLAYYFGFFKGPRLPVLKVNFRPPRNVAQKVLIINIIVLFLFAMYVQSKGGIMSHLLFLGQGRRYLIDEGLLTGEWVVFVRLAILACVIWLVFNPKSVRNPLFWISAILALIPQFLVVGSRSNLIYFLLIGLILWMMKKQKVSMIVIGIVTTVSVILVGILGEFRSATLRGTVEWSKLTDTGIIESFEGGFQEMIYRSSELSPLYPILARVPNEVPFLYGESYFALLSTPIPRAIWLEKPRTTGIIIGEIFLNTAVPIPPDPIAEAYWNFHIPGVLIVFFIYGVFHQWLAAVFRKYAREPAIILFYGITLYYLNPTVLAMVKWIQILVSSIFLLILFGAISFRTKQNYSLERNIVKGV